MSAEAPQVVKIDDLVLLRKDQEMGGAVAGGLVMMTPPIDEDYWLFQVPLHEGQALNAFPKFGVIGIGFAVEEADWNTNLPSETPAADILDWIRPNLGPVHVDDEVLLAAIEMLRTAAREHLGTPPEKAAELEELLHAGYERQKEENDGS